jgi:hypothetical protein
MNPPPDWLDPRTLEWAADYCAAMAERLKERPLTRISSYYLAADTCAQGLRQAAMQRRPE